jgi:tRNA modification GTPase
MQPLSDQGTYLTRLTPSGTGAIAALALRGGQSWDVLEKVYRPAGKGDPSAFFTNLRNRAEPGEFWLGRLGIPAAGQMDAVVLALKRREPLPWLEIHCHGGQQVIAFLEEVISSHGVEVRHWTEFLHWATGRSLPVAALEELSKAPTPRTAAILLDQYHGAFERAVDSIRQAAAQSRTEEAQRRREELARWIPLGKHLTTPWKVAIAGAPNVGKSSLINLLAGYQRAIVSPTPGTTRDLVHTRIALDGWPVELIDTAGIRDQADQLEQQGIDLAWEAARQADLCLWLLDASVPPVWPRETPPSLRYVINKIDLPAAWNLGNVPETLKISVETREGVEDLCRCIVRRLIPDPPAKEAGIPFCEEAFQIVDELAKELA